LVAAVTTGVEVVELALYACGVVVAALFLVQLQSFSPCRACLLGVAEGSVRMTEAVEGFDDSVGVSVVAEQGGGVVVMVDGLGVAAAMVVDIAEAVQGVRQVGGVMALVHIEGSLAVVAGGVVVMFSEGEGLVQVADGVFVTTKVGEGDAEVEVARMRVVGSGRWAAASAVASHIASRSCGCPRQ
jgi:hypothetical protein